MSNSSILLFMKDDIISNLNNPEALERMYREDSSTFRREFRNVYPDFKENSLVRFWHERLNFSSDDVSWGNSKSLLFVAFACVVAGLIAKIPAMFNIDEDYFYPRNIGFIVFPILSFYFAWRNKLSIPKITLVAGLTLAALVFINTVPLGNNSDTLTLSCIHLLLFLWAVLGISFVGELSNNAEKRLAYLKFNGDLVVITTLIVIAGAILTGITIGLFSLIGFQIEEFYFKNIVVFGLPAAPIIGTYLTYTNPQLVGKVSPVIARIFSPLVLVMLLAYLGAIVYSGKDPYNDREFLIIFNALLVGVMALIFFSVAETSTTEKNRSEIWILLLLSLITAVVNGIALSAILFRIAEWGITPNRAAVLGSNVLILINLLTVTAHLSMVLSGKGSIARVGKAISFYLPVYFLWTIIVTFVFPFIFKFA